MVRIIIWREFVSNIITFRFLLGFIVCVGLVATNTVVLLRDHEQKLETYRRNQREFLERFHEIAVYSDISTSHRRPRAFKAPELLSIALPPCISNEDLYFHDYHATRRRRDAGLE